MAQTIMTGTIDKKPLPPAMQTKVQDALKGALQSELSIGTTHHIEFTHINIVWDKVKS